jgi:2-polyprenyl-3-methyl-5-hydroxy-6-metoxy-1,4-benzoquinol methylase
MHAAKDELQSFYADHHTDVAKLDDRMRRLAAECERLKPNSIIDVGCGRGFLLQTLRERMPGVVCYGIELSQTLSHQARQNGFTVFDQDLMAGVPLRDGSVDLAVLGEVIEHVFDPDACIEEVRRVIRPGGTLIVTTPNLASWFNRLLLLVGVQPVFSETSTRKKYGHWLSMFGQRRANTQGHLELFTLGALHELLDDLGFTVERTEGYKFYLLQENPIANVFESLFRIRPTLASGFIVTARKR